MRSMYSLPGGCTCFVCFDSIVGATTSGSSTNIDGEFMSLIVCLHTSLIIATQPYNMRS